MNCYKCISFAALSLALASCGNTNSTPDSELDDVVAQIEASVNQATALAKENEELRRNRSATEPSASSSIPTGGKPTNSEAEKTVKSFINLNGELCAQIVSVRPLSMPNTAEVTCIEYTGGSSRVTYVINLESGALQKAG